MPIQYPYKLISTNGVHHLDSHVQLVGISAPLSLSQSCDVYLPPPEVTASLLRIVNRSKGSVTIRAHGRRTIGGSNIHRMPIDSLLVESRLTLLALVGDDGNLNGNWTLVGGNCAQMATLSLASHQSVEPNVATKIVPVVEFDACNAMADAGYTPKEKDFYIVDLQVLGIGMTAGKNVWVGFGNEFGSRFSWQSFTCIGGTSDPFAYSLKSILDPERSYSIYVRHNEDDAKNFGVISATIKRAI